MNNFFVAFSDLTEEKIFTSANIDIPCIDMEIDGDDGLILEEDKIIRFLTLLKIDVSAQTETSIPGILKLTVRDSETVTFMPTAVQEPAAPRERVAISAPNGFLNEYWEQQLQVLKNRLSQYYPHTIVIHEAVDDEDRDIRPVDDELHLVIGAGITASVIDGRVSYRPGGQVIGFRKISDDFTFSEYDRLINDIHLYLPVVMAATAEEGENLMARQGVKMEIVAPCGYYNNGWQDLFINLSDWLRTNVTGVKRIKLYERYCASEGLPTRAQTDDELHIIVGRELNLSEDQGNNIGYLANGRVVNIFGLNDTPDDFDLAFCVDLLEHYIPIALGQAPAGLRPQDVFFITPNNWVGQMKLERVEALIRQIILPAVNKNIKLFVPHGSNHPLPANDDFNILIWSSLNGSKKNAMTAARMWGYGVGCTDPGFLPSDLADFVITDETNDDNPIAEIIGNNLYIFHDICHEDYHDDYNIFRKILEKALKFLQLPEEEQKK
ncbi:MAG: hypothetical protein A3B89_01495 [Candidatus Buchananbacteria bacterium RIFCSPHIGHO2_02_FULL_40_13]|uniref:Uncharacterized protein n=1 Tax=Candidatus Buchananbacteria bacterium RIFCSPLOWO2_01_FULL_39_33 TaxID=1797543 RepID=A0A1G1YLC1_9BACT|nr:MAG: hypothetical protein A2820_03645 [Candidatus Buchananbacteria bacterium RIFCSPHIGHO2_01_FULL_40_35]OGY50160.1 MAG: hypothetical protein A3B89_01495 [Candidatus Buchananbacteria bacterium RIFCSPHIGHO2_02_FULL_40_13]OGY53143.1 MAG: hypothetical protein A3A02_00305 [Candidatus Buchananbacteria bacterium RIFCSPLOWO2_01_FULL_39_33]